LYCLPFVDCHTPSPKDSRQLHCWLIGIDEDGFFINPALLGRAKLLLQHHIQQANGDSDVLLCPCMQA